MWKTKSETVSVCVYKGSNDEKPSPCHTAATGSAWLDRQVVSGNRYTYLLRITPIKGTPFFTDKITIEY